MGSKTIEELSQFDLGVRVIGQWGARLPWEVWMPMHLRFKLAGIALTLGGLIAGTCHIFSYESSAEVTPVANFACFSEPIHLVLFASLVVVLLGWSEHHSLQSPDSEIMQSVAFVCLFLGILCGDLLHCILEFSVFPVLGSMVPYALPGIAQATYRSAALENLIWGGQCLMFLGGLATAMSICRDRFLPLWAAASFTVSAALLGLGLFPQLSSAVGAASVPAFYISMAVLGVSVLCSQRASKGKESSAIAAAG